MTPPQTLVLPEERRLEGTGRPEPLPGARAAGGRRAQPAAHPLARGSRGRGARARRRSVAAARRRRAWQRVRAAERRTRGRREPRRTRTRSSSGCRSLRPCEPALAAETVFEQDGLDGRVPLGEPRALRDGDRSDRARSRRSDEPVAAGRRSKLLAERRPPPATPRGSGPAQRLARARPGRLASRALPAPEHPRRPGARRGHLRQHAAARRGGGQARARPS